MIILALALNLMSSIYAEVVDFSITSKDGEAKISGSLTYPKDSSEKTPLVIMAPGTGLFDKDVFMGTSGTDEDFIFVAIEKRLLNLGLAVVRMNYRGVSCNFKNYPNQCTTCSPQERMQEYINVCIDKDVRAKVTPDNIRDDYEQVYNWSLHQDKIDSEKIIMFGHSEGTTHISRLIEKNRINPKGLVFMGGVTESLDSLIHWQMVGRLVDNLILMDINNDGVITNEEIKESYQTNLLRIYPLEAFLSPNGSWTKTSFLETLEAQYLVVQTDSLSQENSLPYPNQSLPQASYEWWKMFFTKDSPIIDALSNFNGPIFYHKGDLDSQTNAQREFDFLNQYQGPKPSNVNFIIHPNRGHTLGTDPLFGPIERNSMELLLKSFTDILKI